jgi:hypothetical protein
MTTDFRFFKNRADLIVYGNQRIVRVLAALFSLQQRDRRPPVRREGRLGGEE